MSEEEKPKKLEEVTLVVNTPEELPYQRIEKYEQEGKAVTALLPSEALTEILAALKRIEITLGSK